MVPPPSVFTSPEGVPEIQPFELNEGIVWAFLRGFEGRMKSKDISRIWKSLSDPNAAASFVAGLAMGAYDGARFTIEEYLKSTVAMLTQISNWTLEFYSTVYDPNVLRALVRVFVSSPNTPQRVEALNAFADVYSEHHPAGSAALRSLAEMLPVLDAISKWLRQPGALRDILVALGRQLGEAVGNEIERILSLTGQVYEQGKALGNILGQGVMQIALFLLGAP
jgi:hypothetical protein